MKGQIANTGLVNEGKTWSDIATDALLEGYLVEEWYYQSTRDCFAKVCARTWQSIRTHLWKLAIRYQRQSVINYVPSKRTDRTGQRFTKRDLAIIEGAVSEEGRRNGACKPGWISRILGRSKDEIKEWMVKREEDSPMLVKELEKGETEWEKIARIVYESLQGSFRQLMDDVGDSDEQPG